MGKLILLGLSIVLSKKSPTIFNPSLSSIFGFQFNFSFANVISGCLCFGSSSGIDEYFKSDFELVKSILAVMSLFFLLVAFLMLNSFGLIK